MLDVLIVGVVLAVIGIVLLHLNQAKRLGQGLLTVGLLLVVIIGGVYIGTTICQNVYAEKVEHYSLYTTAGFEK